MRFVYINGWTLGKSSVVFLSIWANLLTGRSVAVYSRVCACRAKRQKSIPCHKWDVIVLHHLWSIIWSPSWGSLTENVVVFFLSFSFYVESKITFRLVAVANAPLNVIKIETEFPKMVNNYKIFGNFKIFAIYFIPDSHCYCLAIM